MEKTSPPLGRNSLRKTAEKRQLFAHFQILRILRYKVIQRYIFAVDRCVAFVQFKKITQLFRGELRLRRLAATNDVNLANAAFRQNLERMLGDVGPAKFIGSFCKNAGNV